MHCGCHRSRVVSARREKLGQWRRPAIVELGKLLSDVETRLSTQPFLHGDRPQLSDLVLLAHARTLLAVPLAWAPWSSVELRSSLARLKVYASSIGHLGAWGDEEIGRFRVGSCLLNEHNDECDP